MEPVILITGASSGIGKEIARFLIEKGYTVYGAARSVDKMTELKALGGHSLYMDVTDDKSMIEGIKVILSEQNRIDVLINNAGYGSYGALEDTPIAQAQAEMNVNVFGLARLTQLVLPVMREQKSGKIINISSIAGKITAPLGSWYYASKHAVEGLSDSLRQEVKPFGIDVIIIEPGGVKSNWASIAAKHLIEFSKGGAYEKLAEKVSRNFPFVEKENANPNVIAHLVHKAIRSKNPKTRYVGGTLAKELLLARKILSDKLLDKAISIYLK
jgi:short-subunit dehydrogenase